MDLNITPAITPSKNWTKLYQLNARNAARKGQLYILIMEYFQRLPKVSNQLYPLNKTICQNLVYIDDDKTVVFKKYDQRGKEEERWMTRLFDFIPDQGVLPSLYFRKFTFLLPKTEADKQNLDYPMLQRVGHDRIAHTMEGMFCKPFQRNLYSLKTLREDYIEEIILARLTPQAKMNAVRAAEYQMLDLSEKNIAFSPLPTPEFSHFDQYRFFYKGIDHSLSELMIDYMKCRITDDTEIDYLGVKTTLKQNPELQRCLKGPWQLTIFDFDFALAEANTAHYQTYMSSILNAAIPFRSDLLGGKDIPFDEETVRLIRTLEQSDEAIERWAKRSDAPIRSFIDEKKLKDLDDLIKKFLEKPRFTLSAFRRNSIADFKDVKKYFVGELADLNQKTLGLWIWLQRELGGNSLQKWFKPYQAMPGDTWEDIASFSKIDVGELKMLNHAISSEEFPTGKIIIKAPLTSHSQSAYSHRQKIARQLWRRITWKQLEALRDRQKNRTRFLNDYDELVSLKKSPHLLSQLHDYINNKVNPLTYLEKERLKSIQDADRLHEALVARCRPSYFNFLKIYYPLLGDAFELNLLIYNSRQKAGEVIGFYKNSLDEVIVVAKKRPAGSDTYKLAHHLEQCLRHRPDPLPIFGRWG